MAAAHGCPTGMSEVAAQGVHFQPWAAVLCSLWARAHGCPWATRWQHLLPGEPRTKSPAQSCGHRVPRVWGASPLVSQHCPRWDFPDTQIPPG